MSTELQNLVRYDRQMSCLRPDGERASEGDRERSVSSLCTDRWWRDWSKAGGHAHYEPGRAV